MDWKKIYEEKKCTAKEAVQSIKSNDRVVFAHAVAEPTSLVDAMVENKEAYENVTISHMFSFGKGEYSLPENSKHFRYEGWFQSLMHMDIAVQAFHRTIPGRRSSLPKWFWLRSTIRYRRRSESHLFTLARSISL